MFKKNKTKTQNVNKYVKTKIQTKPKINKQTVGKQI